MIDWLNKIKIPSKLSLNVIRYILIALVSAVVCNMIIYYGVIEVTGILMDHKTYYQRHIDMTVDAFQSFVTDNDVKIDDYDKLGEWNLDNWHVYLMVYRGDQVYYNTVYSDVYMMPKERKEFTSLYRQDNSLSYPIQFADGEGSIMVRAYFEARFQLLITIISMAASAGCFVLVFLMLFQKKLQYIRQIEKGIKVLENGSLEYCIPEYGRDELYSLAHSINQMSRALKSEMQSKDEIQRERNDMVTSLSHDIRTPLTSVLFYLDIIGEKKPQGNQLEIYSQKARKQAYHMKELMDDLFAYSYVVGEEAVFKVEEYDGHELMNQLLEDVKENLEPEGYHVIIEYGIEGPFCIKADVFQLKRIFDNISSNIKKYALKEEPICLKLYEQQKAVVLCQNNRIREKSLETVSYGIGLKTSQKIAEKLGGSLIFDSMDYHFNIEFRLPMLYI